MLLAFIPYRTELYLISMSHIRGGCYSFGKWERFIDSKRRKASDKNIYVQSVKLNGEPLDACSFKHTDVANGGTLEFVMGSKPSKWGTVGVENQL